MEHELDQINVIPLVDVMLVLLVIVLTTATFITTGQIPVELAKAKEAGDRRDVPLVITLTADGRLFMNEQQVSDDGLRILLTPHPKDSSVVVRADRVTMLERFVEVVDEIRGLGFREVSPVVPTPVQATPAVDRPVQAVETLRQIVPLETTEPALTSEAPPAVREAEAPATPAVSAEAVPDSPPGPTVVSSPVVEETRTAVREFPARPMTAMKADYGWLAEALWSRVEQLKRYPHLARMNRWEGRVVLGVVSQADGHPLGLAVSESSGHSVLDQDALEVLKLASPLTLKHPLGKPQVVVQVPISYRLER